MKHSALGDGLTVSSIGRGAMGMSAFYGPTDEAEAIATLQHAVDIGVTFIDTAEAYGPFENEKLIGRALGSRRDEITIATKASSETDDDGTVHGRNGSPEYIRRACERSLRHLGMDVIDLYYLHWVDPNVPIEESVGALATSCARGRCGTSDCPRRRLPRCGGRMRCIRSQPCSRSSRSSRATRYTTMRGRPQMSSASAWWRSPRSGAGL